MHPENWLSHPTGTATIAQVPFHETPARTPGQLPACVNAAGWPTSAWCLRFSHTSATGGHPPRRAPACLRHSSPARSSQGSTMADPQDWHGGTTAGPQAPPGSVVALAQCSALPSMLTPLPKSRHHCGTSRRVIPELGEFDPDMRHLLWCRAAAAAAYRLRTWRPRAKSSAFTPCHAHTVARINIQKDTCACLGGHAATDVRRRHTCKVLLAFVLNVPAASVEQRPAVLSRVRAALARVRGRATGRRGRGPRWCGPRGLTR